ncbi:MAG: DUF1194 domain-containing protein [Rhodobacteraceae bacterium]|nr:DUF1194 domain-containing protein [Paracoccaceae bacterium]
MTRVIAFFLCLLPLRALSCDLALVLAVDVSGSVDSREYRVQMDGLAEALRDPLVSEALVRSQARLALLQWTGGGRQRVTEDWTAMVDFEAVDRFASVMAEEKRVWRNFSTAVGEALEESMAMLATQTDCARHVIDLSGDGRNNEGIEPAALRGQLRARNITVNALAIEASVPELTAWFFENVLTGPGAFVETAPTYADYPDAIRRKLLREITRQTASLD